jgi:hypothetical protein
MEAKNQDDMQCQEFEALLSEALDQTLTTPKFEGFQDHARKCEICGPMLAEAEEGLRWLKSLTEAEPPAMLVHNILAATTGIETRGAYTVTPRGVSWWESFSATVLRPALGVIRQPRFAMSFGMAFFSLSVALNIAGVKLSDLRHIDLRPTAIKHTYYETSGKIARYYDNMRFVYEIESRVREFKQVAQPVQQNHEEKRKNHKNDTSGQPDQDKERNYSRGDDEPTLASAPNQPPVVTVTTYRRFV